MQFREFQGIPPGVRAFAQERHLATIATLRADGTPHLTPVGFTLAAAPDDTEGSNGAVVRVITFAGATWVRNLRHDPRAAVSWVDGGRWATLEGPATLRTDPESCALAEALYAHKYRPPKSRADRVVIEIAVTRVLAARSLLEGA